jgi:hypothetical protein
MPRTEGVSGIKRPSILRNAALRFSLAIAPLIFANCGRDPLEGLQQPKGNPPTNVAARPDASAPDIRPADAWMPDIRPVDSLAPDIKPAIEPKTRLCQDLNLTDFKTDMISNGDLSDVIEVSNDGSVITLTEYFYIPGVGMYPGSRPYLYDKTEIDLTTGRFTYSFLIPGADDSVLNPGDPDFKNQVGAIKMRIDFDLQQITDPTYQVLIQTVSDCLLTIAQ